MIGQNTVQNNQATYTGLQVEEEFIVINNVNVYLTHPEHDYEEIYDEVIQFRRKIINEGYLDHKRMEIFDKLRKWQLDPENKFAIPWKEHFLTINQIINERSNKVYIPNGILIDYLIFLAENIVKVNHGSLIFKQIRERCVLLMKKMIFLGTPSFIIQVFLDRIHHYIREEDRIPLFQACHNLMNQAANELSEMKGPNRTKTLRHILKIYLAILRRFDITYKELRSFYVFTRPRTILIPFIDLIMFYRVLLWLPTANQQNFRAYVLARKDRDRFFPEYIKTLNFLFKESEFTNNFASSLERIDARRETLKKIKEIFFDNVPPISILLYCLDNGLTHVYEAFLVYTKFGPKLHETMFKLLQHIIVSDKYDISVYTSILATYPDITLELLDTFLMKFIEYHGNENIKLNEQMLKSFRRLILATGSINSSTTWNMSEEFLHYIQTDTFDPKEPHLLQAGRIFLFLNFGIPLTSTEIYENSAEEVTWREVIGFVNIILERESKKSGLTPIPQIHTETNDHDKWVVR